MSILSSLAVVAVDTLGAVQMLLAVLALVAC